MSSSSRNLRAALSGSGVRVCAAVATAMFAGTGARAAEVYWQPDVELRGEGHTNRDLVSDSQASEDMVGYFADLGLLWGRRTPLGETRIRPRLRIQDYPDRSDLRRTEQFLDISSNRATERTNMYFKGRYSRRDAYTAELLQPGFDSFDPSLPATTSDTGRLVLSNRRTAVLVNPGVRHQVTERDGFTADLTGQWVDYETEIAGTQQNYDYERLNLGWLRKLTPRTQFTLGPYAARYNSRLDSGADSNSYGMQFQLNSDLSERTRAVLTLGVDQENIQHSTTAGSDRNSTSWEAMFGLERKTITGILRMNAGRAVVPTGGGTLADSDQVNIQFDRAMSPRWYAGVATRGERRRAHNVLGRGDDRNAASARAGLGWAATPTLSLSGGYEFMYRKFVRDTGGATDHAVFISLRYQGLGPDTGRVRENTPIEFPRW